MTEIEKSTIIELFKNGNSIRTISNNLNKCRRAISKFLKTVEGLCVRSGSRYTSEEVQEILNKDGYFLISEYKNKIHKPFTCRCPKGHEYLTRISTFLKGSRCPKCMADRFRLPQETVFNYIKSFNYIIVSEKYINNRTKIELICPNNHEMSMTYADFKSGYRCRKCYLKERVGENHPNWKKDRDIRERSKQRESNKLKQWSEDIFIRDNYTCQKCNKRGGNLNAHHINGYSWDELNRLNINNGICLCEKCHREFHDIYGYRDKTSVIEYNLWNIDKQIHYPELFQLSFHFGVF